MTVVYLVRHAESAPTPALPEAGWPLSPAGEAQAVALVAALLPLGITRVYSSPYLRARQTVQPFATAAGLPLGTADGLRERKLTEGMVDGWAEHLRQSWRDFDYRLPGGESLRECQARTVRTLRELAARHPHATIAACSHGNAIATALHAADPSAGLDDWRSLRTPDVLRLEVTPGRLFWDRSFRFSLPA